MKIENKEVSVELYQDLVSRQHDERNEFKGMFFAFNNTQFAKGMREVGLNPKDTNSIYSIGVGGYVLRTRSSALGEIGKRHREELKAALAVDKFLLEALVYELENHEYCITYNAGDALDALGLEKSDLPDGMLNKARRLALEWAEA